MDERKEERKTIVNAAKIDATNPIPLETKGKGFYLVKDNLYVPFLDKKDNFFQILLEANLLSPTNLSCVNSKTKFSIGKGLLIDGTVINTKFDNWSKSVNNRNESLNTILKEVFTNLYTCGNCFVEIARKKLGSTYIVYIYVRNIIDCRLVLSEDPGKDYCTHVIISQKFRAGKKWSKLNEEEYVKMPIYTGAKDQKWYKDKAGVEHVILHMKNKMAGYDYYGLPSNVSCLPQQILEYKMSRYNLDSFENNLVVGGIIFLEGNFTDSEAELLANKIKKTHTGDGNRGKFVVLASEQGIANSKVAQFTNNKEYEYINGSRRVEEQIIFANEWSKSLIDPQANGLGDNGKQIREIYEAKMNIVIAPEQQAVKEQVLNPILKIYDECTGSDFSTYNYKFDQLPFLGLSTQIEPELVLTVNEGRKAINYPEMVGEEGQKRIKTSSDVQNKSTQ